MAHLKPSSGIFAPDTCMVWYEALHSRLPLSPSIAFTERSFRIVEPTTSQPSLSPVTSPAPGKSRKRCCT